MEEAINKINKMEKEEHQEKCKICGKEPVSKYGVCEKCYESVNEDVR